MMFDSSQVILKVKISDLLLHSELPLQSISGFCLCDCYGVLIDEEANPCECLSICLGY